MQRVIYADVLVVINVYLTYFLLKATALLAKESPDRLRLFLSSLIGGVYSLTVILPEKVQSAVGIARFGAVVLFVFVAFGFSSVRAFLRLNLCFVLCSFVFAGLMLALWYFISPAGMFFNGSVVYFDIDIFTLVMLTIGCYVFLKLFDRLFRTRAPVNTVFLCCVTYKGEPHELKAFLDTGNSLKDYLTGKPVIIACREKFSLEFPYSPEQNYHSYKEGLRYIPCDTLAGKELLCAFSPENVHIRGAEHNFFTDGVTVALTDKKLFGGEYDAVLPMGLFDKNFDRKDEDESDKASSATEKNQI